MALSEKDIELIQKYLGDTISTQDKLAFDNRIVDQDFKDELLFQSKSIDALVEDDRRSVVEYLKEDSAPVENNDAKPTVNEVVKKPNRSKFFLGIILGILTVFLISYLGKRKNAEPSEKVQPIENTQTHSNQAQLALVNEYNKPYPFLLVGRGDNSSDEALQIVYQNYSKGEYAKALEYFQTNMVEDEQLKLVEANCLLQLSEYKKALRLLNNLKNSGNVEVAQNADWYIAIVQLLMGNNDLGDMQLNFISSTDGHMFNKQASELIEALK